MRAAEPDLKIHMFASFRVLRNGDPVTSRLGGKGKQLIKLLAADPSRAIPKEVLADSLWPDSEPLAAATSLKVAVHNVRTALEPAKRNGGQGTWIVLRDGLYGLNPDVPIWIDSVEFLRHWKAGRRAEIAGDHALAKAEYHEAAEIYEGDYLADDLYDDWPAIRREELRDVHLQLVDKLAKMHMEERDYENALMYAHRIVAADPCREDAYRILLSAHAAMNNVARAGSWYAICWTTLRRELGVNPSRATTRLFESMFESKESLQANGASLGPD